MSLTEQALLLASWEFWGLTLLSAASAISGFYLAFRYLRRARTIEDTPTAKVRSAHQGYVELAGQAISMEGEPILAPLTGKKCCWFSYKIERRGDKHWLTVEKGTSDSLFLLRDETGDCIIDPEGADVTPGHKDVWHGNSRTATTTTGNSSQDVSSLLLKLGASVNSGINVGGRYRFTESRIHSQDQLYAIGMFKTLDEVDHIQHRSEITRDLLRSWKQDMPSLLVEFDRNRDGRIDSTEWENVRQKAENQAHVEQQELLDGSILNTLSETKSSSHPFLLSTLPEFDLVRRYRLFVMLATLAFFSGGALAVWLFTIKFTN